MLNPGTVQLHFQSSLSHVLEGGAWFAIRMEKSRGSRASSRLKSQHFCEFKGDLRRQDGTHSLPQEEFLRELGCSMGFRASKLRWLAITTFCFICFAIFFTQHHSRTSSQLSVTDLAVSDRRRHANGSTPLENFEVSAPVNVPSTDCQVILMKYSFSNSYGHPFVGKSGDVSHPHRHHLVKARSPAMGFLLDLLALSQQSALEIHKMSATLSVAPALAQYITDSNHCKSLDVIVISVHPSTLRPIVIHALQQP